MSRPALALSALFGVLGGVSAFTFRYAEGAAYLSNDPRACVNCHLMREHFDGWQKASHHAVATCNDCHTPHQTLRKYLTKAENGFWHSKGFTLQDFHEPLRIRPGNARLLNRNCIDCHRELVRELLSGGRAQEPSLNCVRCHAQVGHGPTK